MVLGSFLDSFQKIADAATNTKGETEEKEQELNSEAKISLKVSLF